MEPLHLIGIRVLNITKHTLESPGHIYWRVEIINKMIPVEILNVELFDLIL